MGGGRGVGGRGLAKEGKKCVFKYKNPSTPYHNYLKFSIAIDG